MSLIPNIKHAKAKKMIYIFFQGWHFVLKVALTRPLFNLSGFVSSTPILNTCEVLSKGGKYYCSRFSQYRGVLFFLKAVFETRNDEMTSSARADYELVHPDETIGPFIRES